MSRAARTARGAIGAVLATVLAAASHSLAGGEVSAFAVFAAGVVALPVCVALAGRAQSLWRIALAVTVSQFLYHWAFSGIGNPGYDSATGFPGGAHAAHLASYGKFVPDAVAEGSADSLMWAMHAVAAIVSTLLIVRGERAVLAVGRSIRRALPQTFNVAAFERPAVLPVWRRTHVLRPQLANLSSRSLRGPPVSVIAP